MTRSENATLAQLTVGRGVGAGDGAWVSQSFSYHETVLSSQLAESASTSPSPSRSVAETSIAQSASVVITCSAKDWEPSFSHHAIVSYAQSPDSTSTSPSPSTSAADTISA